jgi:hypothetical protein
MLLKGDEGGAILSLVSTVGFAIFWNDSGLHAFVFIPTRRFPVPNTLQIPLERHRDVQRRWQHMLQRTAAPRSTPSVGLKYSRTPVRFDRPINGSFIKPKS